MNDKMDEEPMSVRGGLLRFIPKGWQKVAGSRSAAQTPGSGRLTPEHPGGMPEERTSRRTMTSVLASLQDASNTAKCFPGVCAALRPPATVCHPFGMKSILSFGMKTVLCHAGLCLFALLVINSAIAQEPQVAKPAVAPPVNPNPDIAARPTIILPYDDPKEPLAAERVYLPHAKFVELWNAAHPESRVAPQAPQDGLVAEALVVVAPNKKVDGADATAKVTARVTLFSFRKQQIVLPVPLRLASISEAKLDDAPASIVVLGEGAAARLHVVIDKPGLHVLDLTAEVPVNQQGPSGQLVIGVDPLPSGKLLFMPPVEDVTFRVNGASNLFRVRGDAEARRRGDAEKTHFEVAISAGGDVRLAWQPKQAAGAVDAIVQADSTTAVGVEDAGVRIASGWVFKVPRGAINDLSFSLP